MTSIPTTRSVRPSRPVSMMGSPNADSTPPRRTSTASLQSPASPPPVKPSTGSLSRRTSAVGLTSPPRMGSGGNNLRSPVPSRFGGSTRAMSPPAPSVASSVSSRGARSSIGLGSPSINRTSKTIGSGLIQRKPSTLKQTERSFKSRYQAYGEPALSLASELDELTARYSLLEDQLTEAEERLRILEGCDKRLIFLMKEFEEIKKENLELKEENSGLVLQWVNSREKKEDVIVVAKDDPLTDRPQSPEAPTAPAIKVKSDSPSELKAAPMPLRSEKSNSSLAPSEGSSEAQASDSLSSSQPIPVTPERKSAGPGLPPTPTSPTPSKTDVEIQTIASCLRSLQEIAANVTESFPFAVSKCDLISADFSKARISHAGNAAEVLEMMKGKAVKAGGGKPDVLGFLGAAMLWSCCHYFEVHLLDSFRTGLDNKTNKILDKIRISLLKAETTKTYFQWRSVTYRNLNPLVPEDAELVSFSITQISKDLNSILSCIIPEEKESLYRNCQDVVRAQKPKIEAVMKEGLKIVHSRKVGSQVGGERNFTVKKGERFDQAKMKVQEDLALKSGTQERLVELCLSPGIMNAANRVEVKAIVVLQDAGAPKAE